MAQINLENISKIEKHRNTVQKKAHATTYTVFEMDDKKYVQIDTYGTIDRKKPEQVSQTIQFDKDSAVFLVDILRKEFDL